MIKWTKTTAGSCRSYDEVPKDVTIESVNGIDVMGICENCGKPVLETQIFNENEYGIMWHVNCKKPTSIIQG